MIRIIAFLLALLPAVAMADLLPALHDVAGVASDDVLNIREAPSASTPIIGELGPDARDVEVIGLSDNGTWGLVNIDERAGWVSMRFLARQPGQDWMAGGEFGISPVPLDCFGTEPFWSLHLSTGDMMTFHDPFDGDGTPQPGIFSPLQPSASSGKFGFLGGREDGLAHYTGILNRQICSDGMSDRLYGLSIDLVRETPMGNRLFTGCCRLAP